MLPMTPLRAYALSMSPPEWPSWPSSGPASKPQASEREPVCMTHTESARKAARARWDGKPKKPVTGHRAGDHSACELDSRHGVCSECGKTVRVTRTSAPPERRRCRECRQVNPRPRNTWGRGRVGDPRTCELCGEEYVLRRGARPDQRWCSKSCAQAWRNGARPPYQRNVVVGMPRKAQLRRIRSQRKTQTWDGVTDAEIFERDRWRCGICRKRIGKSFKYPHPRSKSIDHIVPLSEGGDDTAANKRAAHLECNRRRMNRGGGEQLAMIG